MIGVTRFQIVRWFGKLNNRQLKTVHRPLPHKCGLCGSNMERTLGLPLNVKPFPVNRGEEGFVKDFALEHVEDYGELDGER